MKQNSKIKIVSLLISLIFVIPQISSAVCLKFWYPSQFSLKNDCPVSANSGTGSIPSNNSGSNSGVSSQSGVNDVSGLFDLFGYFLSRLLGIIISLSIIFFIWNIFRYEFFYGNEEEKMMYRRQMFWGIVAIFVSVSIWGLVAILQQTFTPVRVSAPDSQSLMPTF